MQNSNLITINNEKVGVFYIEPYDEALREEPDRIKVYDSDGNYFSYIPSATNSQSSNSISSTVNYMVRVTADVLNIRQGPGTTYKICGCIKDRGLYTIIKENGNWGYLKSGLGWICLDYTKKE